jgi:hypothetical protein
MVTESKPQWQPLSLLPVVAMMIDEVLQNSEEQHETFSEVKDKPHVLDDATISRAIRLYKAQLEDVQLYREQLTRWQMQPLTGDQRREVDRLLGQLPRIKYATPVTTVTDDTQIEVQAMAFSLRLIDSTGQSIENARVNLRKANDAYVTYTKTNANGVASFEVVPGAQVKLEIDYHGGKHATDVTAVDADMQLDVQTVALTVHVTANDIDLVNQRVDLLKANSGYVTYARTGTDGRVVFEVLPGAQHKVRCTYDGNTWISDGIIGPAEVAYDFV